VGCFVGSDFDAERGPYPDWVLARAIVDELRFGFGRAFGFGFELSPERDGDGWFLARATGEADASAASGERTIGRLTCGFSGAGFEPPSVSRVEREESR
jgi:hypothetical protein